MSNYPKRPGPAVGGILDRLGKPNFARRLAEKRAGLRKPRKPSFISGGSVVEERVTATADVHKSKARLAIEELAEKRPALLEAPIAYLQVYLSDGQNRVRTLQRSPILYFALTQCSLSYRYICNRLQNRTLKAVMLRESMVNLITLIHTLGKSNPEISEPVADQLQKFIAVLEDLDRQLAELSGIVALNWQTISSVLKTTVQSHKEMCDPRPFTEFVPSIEDFVACKVLGKGAFGVVYKALYKEDLDVAVKVVPQNRFHNDPKDDTPFMDKMVGSVIPNHPYICRIYCAFIASIRDTLNSGTESLASSPCSTLTTQPGVSVTVMEAIDGMDLTELVGKNTMLSFNLTQTIMQQLMLAIEHMHLSGFIHRDIKPANMMVTRDGRIKLIDFDVNRVCISHFGNQYQMSYFKRTANEFATCDKAGTEAYMAPEVHQGKAYGRASDWWSVGIVHFRLAYGRLPFRSQNLAYQIVNQDIEWEKVCQSSDPQSETLKNYLSSLLTKNPRDRLGSREYMDIFTHPLFFEVNWQRLPKQQVWCEELDAAFTERSSSFVEKERLTVKPAVGHGKDEPPSLHSLIDNTKIHMPLLTYSSKLIKKMVMGNTGGSEACEEDPRWRHVGDLKKIADDTTGGTTTTDMKQRKEPVQVIIQEYTGTKGLFRGRRHVVAFHRLLCEDGLLRYMVADMALGTKIISDAKLYCGDLVLEIDKTSLTNLPERRVALLLSKRGAPLVLSVAQGNPLREAGEATFDMSQLLHRFKSCHVRLNGQLKSRKCQWWQRPHVVHGFTLTVRKVFSAGSAELVCFVDSHDLTKQRIVTSQGIICGLHEENTGSNLFAGDVILSLNNMRLEQLARGRDPEKQIRTLMSNLSVELDVVPCSPLRIGNLPQGEQNP
ncbi:protein kinase-like [Tropilaelaps mercedesae]|uniref:Serine/threonine-protein kinase greatwall n=1 Tax=Tropilaelaps mercedesae TaxID=418985 RepID=A0A1V9Y089_9ACAR|nr:protein kinase-like [Tropilaelaps mercedesae]